MAKAMSLMASRLKKDVVVEFMSENNSMEMGEGGASDPSMFELKA
jgi:hypothetical protein